MKTKLQLMEDAWRDYPSQDNEGYQPERGSFKCGFFSGFDARDAEVAKLREMVKAARDGLEYYANDSALKESSYVAISSNFKSDNCARATLARLDEMEGNSK